VLHEAFGPRVIGLQITRDGDGMDFERRPVRGAVMSVYTIGRTYLLELLQSEMQSDLVRFVDDPMSRQAYQQLANLETEVRETGIVYKCLPGEHDDLGISVAMVAWAAQHPHLDGWTQIGSPRADRDFTGHNIILGRPLRDDRPVGRAAGFDPRQDCCRDAQVADSEQPHCSLVVMLSRDPV
jgi:hypothetical protein